jgi:hypothetical protein
VQRRGRAGEGASRSGGRVRSADRDLYRVAPIGGDSFEDDVEHDGEPLRGEERQKQQFELQKRERSYYKEISDAFEFKILGEETLPTSPAWVLEATPRLGFQPRSRYAQAPQDAGQALDRQARRLMGQGRRGGDRQCPLRLVYRQHVLLQPQF